MHVGYNIKEGKHNLPTQTKGYGTSDKIRFEAEQIIQRKSQPGQRERERGREEPEREHNEQPVTLV